MSRVRKVSGFWQAVIALGLLALGGCSRHANNTDERASQHSSVARVADRDGVTIYRFVSTADGLDGFDSIQGFYGVDKDGHAFALHTH